MAERPTGTLTFLFTDIEGSTRRWEAFAGPMHDALRRHDSILADSIEGAGGRIFKHTGDGVCAVFPTASTAVAAAVEAQRRLASGEWSDVAGLSIRMGLHSGEAGERDGDYFGPALNRTARLMSAAHGGQILLSSATAALLGNDAPDGVSLRDLGSHQLPDLGSAEDLYQVAGEGLTSDFPPPRTGSRLQSNNLPANRSSFVGRADEIHQLTELVQKASLVTLVGIGGTGKTRLAIEVAAAALDHFEGVWFVELAPLADGKQIPASIAGALNLSVGGPGAGSLIDAVAAALARQRSLLILDNCEHLVDDCADLVDILLERCPQLVILATSREALAVEGEHPWAVTSLPDTESVALFADRAMAVDPRFRVGPDNEGAIADICARLDGIPLAIELAASRLGHLSITELAARLDDRFRLLTGGRRRRAQRQQTLQAAIDWSHDLLEESERLLLRRLSVFAGGFTLAAAEGICALDDAERRGAVDVLGNLVSKSLVIADVGEERMRYRMLETIRLYAADRLVDAGEAEQLRDRHRDWWLAWLEQHPLDGLAIQWEVATAVEVELDNLRAALDWSESQHRVDLAARIATGMGAVWVLLGHHDEGSARCQAVTASGSLPGELTARLMAVTSQLHMARGELDKMAEAAKRSVELEPEGPLAALAHVWRSLYLVFDIERFGDAHAGFDEARRLADIHGQPGVRELADAVESHFYLVEGDLDRPVNLAQRLPPSHSFADFNARGAAIAALIERDEPEEAMKQVDLLAPPQGGGGSSAAMGTLVLVELGALDEAHQQAHVAALQYLEQPFPLTLGDALMAMAALAIATGDPGRGAEVLESIIAERGLAGFRSPSSFVLWRRYRRRARAALDPAAFEEAKERGRRVTPIDVLHREMALLRGAEQLDPGA